MRNHVSPVVLPRALSTVDSLERRRMLAFTSLTAAGTLLVEGTSGNDSILVQTTTSSVKATRNGASESWPVGAVHLVQISGAAGNDTLTAITNVDAVIDGGTGNDRINGTAGADLIDGAEDNDTIYGNGGGDFIYDGLGNDLVDGGTGDDHLFVEAADGFTDADGPDTYSGGSGNDTIDYSARTLGVTVSLDGLQNDGYVDEFDWIKGGVDNIIGSQGDDLMIGNNSANQILGNASYYGDNDLVYGLGGNDNLSGFYVDPGYGNDTLYGEIIDYSARVSPLHFSRIGDPTEGVYAGGQAGETDTIYSRGLGVSILDSDYIFYSTVRLGKGNDSFTNVYEMRVDGGPGNDTLRAAVDDNPDPFLKTELNGSQGDDTLGGGFGNAFTTGDEGKDTLDYSAATANLTVFLDRGPATEVQAGHVFAVDVEIVQGGHGNDVINGTNASETLLGNGGDDAIYGGGGNDSILGSDGNDELFGQAGADTVRGGSGLDLISGGSGRDKLFGDSGNDLLRSLDGQIDTLDGGLGTDVARADHGSIVDQLFAVETVL